MDLAGSERIKQTAATGQRLKEAQNINKYVGVISMWEVLDWSVCISELLQRVVLGKFCLLL